MYTPPRYPGSIDGGYSPGILVVQPGYPGGYSPGILVGIVLPGILEGGVLPGYVPWWEVYYPGMYHGGYTSLPTMPLVYHPGYTSIPTVHPLSVHHLLLRLRCRVRTSWAQDGRFPWVRASVPS